MQFAFTPEQQQLRDSLQKYLRANYGFDARRAIQKSAGGASAAVWRDLAELGVLAMTLPEAHGGFGGGALDTYLVMEECGRALVLEPYLSTVVLGAGLVARCGSAAQQGDVLPAVAGGERQLGFAHYEPGQRYAPFAVSTTARSDGGGWRLEGEKTFVLGGASAEQLIVSARTGGSGTGREPDGLSLFLVDRSAPGIEVRPYTMYDGGRAATVRLNGVRVGSDALLGEEDQAAEPLGAAIDAAIGAICAEAVGAMSVLIETTGQFLKTRKQFGVPLGTFQVLQHRLADMLLETELARSMALLAATQLDSPAPERRRAISAAKVRVGQAARFVGQQAVQLHGGIGVTDELAVSHYFKRLTMIDASFGDVDFHLGEFTRRST